jgi:adenylate cyclase class 1
LWWLVPSEEEENYYDIVKVLKRKRFIRENEYVDFGPLAGVPAEEFFGAALWQLYKGIDSPYKSVLKLLMMEVYAAEYPKTEVLCQRFKKAVYDGVTSLDQLDPYIMLYRKIEEYLVGRGEDERLELVRRCFYFKIGEPLSARIKASDNSWRRDVMMEITQAWEWDDYYLKMLDSRHKWKIGQVTKERAVLVKALTFSYKFLSDFARRHAQLVAIKQKDMNILGRKLYAAFERKAGKVELVNRGISHDVWESHLTFYRVQTPDKGEAWLLHAAPLNVNEARKQRPLRRSHSLIELLAWCHFNDMMNSNTVLAMYSEDSRVTPRELKEMLGTFQKLFPVENALKTEISDFEQGARLAQAAAFVNLGMDPMIEYARQGKHLMSNKSDALSYGGLGENLALSFDLITVSSWKEVLTARYTGVTGLLDCLRDYLRWVPPARGMVPPPFSAHCYSFGRGMTIKQRIEELFSDVVQVFCGSEDGPDQRYLLVIEQVYYILYMEKNVLHYEKITTYGDLQNYLGSGLGKYMPLIIDRHALSNTVLPAIFAANKPRVLQVFYQVVEGDVEVYVLDERGAMFQQRMDMADRNTTLNHFSQFFDSVLQRQYFEIADIDDPGEASEVEAIEYYEIVQKNGRKPMVIKREVMPQRRLDNRLNIQVIGEVVDERAVFNLFCNDREFSSMEFGNDLFSEAARYVLQQRRSGERYAIYITDLDLPHALIEGDVTDGKVQTIHFLNYKRRIESKLNAALRQLELDSVENA